MRRATCRTGREADLERMGGELQRQVPGCVPESTPVHRSTAARHSIEAWKIHYNTIRLAFPLFLSQPQRRIAFHPFLTLDLDLNKASDMFQTAGRI